MTTYIVLLRIPNTTGWEYYGEALAPNPEEAARKVLLDEGETLDSYLRECHGEIRVIPMMTDERGEPLQMRGKDLQL